MLKLSPGDKVAWGLWQIGTVVESFPKGQVLIMGREDHYFSTEFMVNSTHSYFHKVEVGEGYRIVEDHEFIEAGDEAYSGVEWGPVSRGWSGDRTPYRFRRKLNAQV